MEYSRLKWKHDATDLPVEVLSEYDADGWEVRKVEVFPDGSFGLAGPSGTAGTTQLSLVTRTPDDEVNAPPEFRVEPLTAAEFERYWSRATSATAGRAVPAA